jgi:hypothetical protein
MFFKTFEQSLIRTIALQSLAKPNTHQPGIIPEGAAVAKS